MESFSPWSQAFGSRHWIILWAFCHVVSVIKTHRNVLERKGINLHCVKGLSLISDFPFFPGMACGILVPQPGIKPVIPALEAWSLNHWTAREVLRVSTLNRDLGENSFSPCPSLHSQGWRPCSPSDDGPAWNTEWPTIHSGSWTWGARPWEAEVEGYEEVDPGLLYFLVTAGLATRWMLFLKTPTCVEEREPSHMAGGNAVKSSTLHTPLKRNSGVT